MPKSASAESEWGIIRLRESTSDAQNSRDKIIARHFSDTLAFQVAGTCGIATIAEGCAQSNAAHFYKQLKNHRFTFLALTVAAACPRRTAYPAIIGLSMARRNETDPDKCGALAFREAIWRIHSGCKQ